MLVGLRPTLYVVLFGAGIAFAMVHCRYAVIAAVLKWLVLSLFAYVVTAFLVPTGPRWRSRLSCRRSRGPIDMADRGGGARDYHLAVSSGRRRRRSRRKRWPSQRGPAARGNGGRARRPQAGRQRGDVSLQSRHVLHHPDRGLTLHAQGQTQIASSRQAAEALRPLAGDFAVWALCRRHHCSRPPVPIPTFGGLGGLRLRRNTRLAGRARQEASATRSVYYTTIILWVAIAVLIDFLKIDPIQSLFWSAIVNGVLAPFLSVGILLSARDPHIMKKKPSSVAAQAIVEVATLANPGAAGVMLWSILQGG